MSLRPPNLFHAPAPEPADPAYWITPRHLAGDDGALAEQVGNALTGLGWSCWTTSRRTLVHVSPDGLRGAEWILADEPLQLGGLPVAWEISARTDPGHALLAWTAYFTAGTPHEALTAFVLTLDARDDPAFGLDGPECVVAALTARGWRPDEALASAWSPELTSCFTWCTLPALIEDQDPREDLAGWQAWAEPAADRPYVWCATFSHSTPHDLVAAFASALADPAPVLRRVLPEQSAGRLTLIAAS